jgi:hypothetical protein
MKKLTKKDIKRIEDQLRKIKKTKVKEDIAEDTSPEIQAGEESAWQFSDFSSISVFETKKETQK